MYSMLYILLVFILFSFYSLFSLSGRKTHLHHEYLVQLYGYKSHLNLILQVSFTYKDKINNGHDLMNKNEHKFPPDMQSIRMSEKIVNLPNPLVQPEWVTQQLQSGTNETAETSGQRKNTTSSFLPFLLSLFNHTDINNSFDIFCMVIAWSLRRTMQKVLTV